MFFIINMILAAVILLSTKSVLAAPTAVSPSEGTGPSMEKDYAYEIKYGNPGALEFSGFDMSDYVAEDEKDKKNDEVETKQIIQVLEKVDQLAKSKFAVILKDRGDLTYGDELIYIIRGFEKNNNIRKGTDEKQILRFLKKFVRQVSDNNLHKALLNLRGLEYILMGRLKNSFITKEVRKYFNKYMNSLKEMKNNGSLGDFELVKHEELISLLDTVAHSLTQIDKDDKLAEIFGFLNDFLMLKNEMIEMNLELLHNIYQRLKLENPDSEVVRVINALAANLWNTEDESLSLDEMEENQEDYIRTMKSLSANSIFMENFRADK